MGSVMPPRQEEEFELVLGNKQLLSLFFVIVALFAVFFTFGYSVGFTQGQQERVAVIANDEPADPPPADVRLPDALLEEVAKPAADPPPSPAPAQADSPKPKAVAPSAPKKQAPPPRPAPTKKAVASNGAQIARGIHIQVAALRVASDARLLVNKLKAKGYPVALYSRGGDGWNRVVVGPFRSVDTAKAAQKRLQSDGLRTILRKP